MVGLYKDPHGINIFKNPHTELTEPASTVKKEIGGACHSVLKLRRISHEVTIVYKCRLYETKNSYDLSLGIIVY